MVGGVETCLWHVCTMMADGRDVPLARLYGDERDVPSARLYVNVIVMILPSISTTCRVPAFSFHCARVSSAMAPA